MLRDSAHLQEEDAALRRRGTGFSKHHPALPLYDAGDVERTLALLRRVPLRRADAGARRRGRDPAPGGPHPRLGHCARARRRRRHACCSAATSAAPDHPLLRPPRRPAGGRRRRGRVDVRRPRAPAPPRPATRLADAFRRTVAPRRLVLVPAFAVDRTELVLLALHRLRRAGPDPDGARSSSTARWRWPRWRSTARAVDADPALRPAAGTAARPVRPADLRAPGQRRRGVAAAQRPAAPVHHRLGLGHGHRRPGRAPPGPAAGDPRNSVVLTGLPGAGHPRPRAGARRPRRSRSHGRYVPVRAEVVDVSRVLGARRRRRAGRLAGRVPPAAPRTALRRARRAGRGAALAARVARRARLVRGGARTRGDRALWLTRSRGGRAPPGADRAVERSSRRSCPGAARHRRAAARRTRRPAGVRAPLGDRGRPAGLRGRRLPAGSPGARRPRPRLPLSTSSPSCFTTGSASPVSSDSSISRLSCTSTAPSATTCAPARSSTTSSSTSSRSASSCSCPSRTALGLRRARRRAAHRASRLARSSWYTPMTLLATITAGEQRVLR